MDAFFEADSQAERAQTQLLFPEITKSFGFHVWRRWFISFASYQASYAQQSADHVSRETTTTSYMAQETAVQNMIKTFNFVVHLLITDYKVDLTVWETSQVLCARSPPMIIYEELSQLEDTNRDITSSSVQQNGPTSTSATNDTGRRIYSDIEHESGTDSTMSYG